MRRVAEVLGFALLLLPACSSADAHRTAPLDSADTGLPAYLAQNGKYHLVSAARFE